MKAAALVLAGALAGTTALPEGSNWPLWFALAPLLWAVEGLRPGRAFVFGWAWGLAACAVALYWMPRVALQFTGGAPALKLAAAAGIFAWHALTVALPAAAAAGAARLAERRGLDPVAAAAVALAPAFVLCEGLFPQANPSYVAASQLVRPVSAQLLSLAGAGGLAWAIAAVNSGTYLALRPGPRLRRLAGAATAAAVLASVEAFGRARLARLDASDARALAEGRAVRAALLQGALPLERRNDPAWREENIAVYTALTERAARDGVELVVWPANTYERPLEFSPGDAAMERPSLEGGGALAAALFRDVPGGVHAVLTGSSRSPETAKTETPSRHWTAVLKAPDGAVLGATNKGNPTPLGETKPFGTLLPALHRLTPKIKRLLPGPSRVLTTLGGTRLGVYICYDGMLAGPARALARAGAEVLVHPASDQWSFDQGAQPVQHLRVSMQRAVETGRWLLRATPSGVTAVVDSGGRLRGRLAPGEPGHIVARVPLLVEATPYARLGDWPYAAAGLALAALTAALGTASARRRDQARLDA